MSLKAPLAAAAIIGCFPLAATAQAPPESALASFGNDGRLEYGLYANTGESNAVNRLPDFSHAGYMGGGVPLPDVPVAITVSPAPGDDTARIQAAIDTVSGFSPNPDGFRGAVFLAAGTYTLEESLWIEADGVVLRGAGQDTLGTVLGAPGTARRNVIFIGPAGGEPAPVSGTERTVTTPYVPVGAVEFDVADASGAGFAPGDRIGIQYTRNEEWVDALGMAPYDWTPDFFSVTHQRDIIAVDGNSITIDVPIVDVIQDAYGGARVFRLDPWSPSIRNSGVEHLRLVSSFASNTDNDHAWTAVRVWNAEDCWVRNVTAVHFAYATVDMRNWARRVTVQDCAFLDPKSSVEGGLRYAFVLQPVASQILFQRCYAEFGRHDFVTNSRSAGPNAWVDCIGVHNLIDSGPHQRWATGLLYDNVRTNNMLAVENRGGATSNHGWAGATVAFWNCQAARMRCHAPVGAMNFAIGSVAEQVPGGANPDEPLGIWEHLGQHVAPRSLYFQQLQDRRGTAAVQAVTDPRQAAGPIWNGLHGWAGRDAFQPAPLASERPHVTFGAGQATLAVQPLASATISEYQWFEIIGGEFFPLGGNAPTLDVPLPSEPAPARSFFCRVVTDRGPWWSQTAVIQGGTELDIPLATNQYVIGFAEEAAYLQSYAGGNEANLVGSGGGTGNRRHFNPLMSFLLPDLADGTVLSAHLEFDRHSSETGTLASADLYGLDPREAGYTLLDGTLWHQGGQDSRSFAAFYAPAAVNRTDPPDTRYSVDVTSYVQSLYDGSAPGLDRAVFRLSPSEETALTVLSRLAVYNQPEGDGTYAPPILKITVEPTASFVQGWYLF